MRIKKKSCLLHSLQERKPPEQWGLPNGGMHPMIKTLGEAFKKMLPQRAVCCMAFTSGMNLLASPHPPFSHAVSLSPAFHCEITGVSNFMLIVIYGLTLFKIFLNCC